MARFGFQLRLSHSLAFAEVERQDPQGASAPLVWGPTEAKCLPKVAGDRKKAGL